MLFLKWLYQFSFPLVRYESAGASPQLSIISCFSRCAVESYLNVSFNYISLITNDFSIFLCPYWPLCILLDLYVCTHGSCFLYHEMHHERRESNRC